MICKKIDTHVHAVKVRTDTPGSNPRCSELEFVSAGTELRAHLEAQGIEKAILMSSGESEGRLSGKVMGNNQECIELCQEQGDFYLWMCNLDFCDPDTVYDRLRNYKKEGAVGLGELRINQWIDSPFLSAVFNAAEELCLPVTAHMSVAPGVSYGICDRPGLPLLEKLLSDHPKLTFVGHSQVFWNEISGDAPVDDRQRFGLGQGPVVSGGRIPELMERHLNLYADLSAFSGSCAIMRDEAFGLAFLEKYQDRLFYATDTVNDKQKFPLGEFLTQAYTGGKLSQTAYTKIVRLNAERVYHISK